MVLNSFILISLLSFTLITFIFNLNKTKSHITLLGLTSTSMVAIFISWAVNGFPSTLLTTSWYNSSIVNFSFSISLDFFSVTFFTVGLFVTWSIIEFAHYYMSADPNQFRFVNTLILFLLFMLILVSANNIFILFVGWEGVGIMSFVLISWWFTRQDANSSALQAVIYNRIGDSGILLTMAVSAFLLNSWELNNIITLSNNATTWLLAIGIMVAATGKSAQFSLHPWLPSAMEGPTPVSALLHSSTMVVAGVFLLIRTTPILANTNWALPITGLLGSITALFAATAALTQNDFKKVIAYSTTSQLGLMVVAVSINFPILALFHICTHAFFKALLFLCSGSVIHSFSNEQDLRKISTAANTTPFTTATIVVASLALCGLPFLAGFYSKDLILEMAQTSNTNTLSALLAFVATFMTAVYTLRTLYFILYPINNTMTISPISETNLNLNFSLIRLITGATLAGWSFSLVIFNTSPALLPLSLKNIPIALLLAATTLLVLNNINLGNTQATKFLATNWFFVQIIHTLMPFTTIANSIKGVLRTIDHGWLSTTAAVIINAVKTSISSAQNSFNSLLIQYIFASITIILAISAMLSAILI
uniref:NADH dehydrogenase subunit 5 n=1 Tax=Ophiothrix exigua TaxID=1815227 RepID=UPI00286C3DE0|nr:NADH dehydrogenase subunit 5 [Ophiothrix exigua]WKW95563.1 NADH dehydrogenase subunit 5 [Ophiothrix exigua]